MDSPANAHPVTAMASEATSSRRRIEKRWPQRPTASVVNRGAEQRRRADQADFELPEPERKQVGGQHHRDEAVGKRAQRPRRKHAAGHLREP